MGPNSERHIDRDKQGQVVQVTDRRQGTAKTEGGAAQITRVGPNEYNVGPVGNPSKEAKAKNLRLSPDGKTMDFDGMGRFAGMHQHTDQKGSGNHAHCVPGRPHCKRRTKF